MTSTRILRRTIASTLFGLTYAAPPAHVGDAREARHRGARHPLRLSSGSARHRGDVTSMGSHLA